MRPLRPTLLAVVASSTVACGTVVSTGDNLEKGRPETFDATPMDAEDSAVGPEITVGDGNAPVYAPDGTLVNPPTNGESGGTSGASLTCFGPAPGLTQDMLTFCNDLSADLKARFAVALSLLCSERRLLNLTFKTCSWQGVGSSDKFRRVLSRTDMEDQTTTDFTSVIAYGVTTESDPDGQLALIFGEMTDPNYGDKFVEVRNTRLSNIVALGPEAFEYKAELASSAATVSFRARLEARRITDNLIAVFDYSIGDTVILKEHKFLRLLFRAEPGTTRIVAIDEKLVGDGGTHAVAYQNVTDVLKQRMERDHENSRRD